jgi:uncharacterized protein
MRRNDKQIIDTAEIEDILSRALVCRLALCDDGWPYIVPLCFGYKDNTFYFHCANQGKKLDIIRKNPNACVEVDIDHKLVAQDQDACKYGFGYKSVIAFGKAEVLIDLEAKRRALDIIMQHYSKGQFTYIPESLDGIVIIKMQVDEMTAKKSG